MTIREIYKTCCTSVGQIVFAFTVRGTHPYNSTLGYVSATMIYPARRTDPGFGAGTGSGAYAPGLQAGGSSTKASTSGAMLGKGVATMRKKVADEEMRKRLDTRHEFFNLIKH